MLRYKTKTRPGLVALYDIRPGNGAGPFLQPWSPHGAEQLGSDDLPTPNKQRQSTESKSPYDNTVKHTLTCIQPF